MMDDILEAIREQSEQLCDIKTLIDYRIPMGIRKTEDSLIKEQVIPATTSINTSPINQETYNRARLFMGVGFGTLHVGDVVVDMYYQNTKIHRVLTISPGGGSTGGASQSFDVNHLTGFYFKIRNLDPVNPVTIRNARIVLYHGNGEKTSTITKTVNLVQDWTAVAQNTIVASSEYDLSGVTESILYLQAALDTTTAHTGTRFITQVSASYSGDEDWQDHNDFVALIGTAATDLIENDPLAAGSTDIALTGHALTVLGKWLLIEDDDVAAQGTITMSGIATADETFVIDSQTFTWKASRSTTGEVTIGADAPAAVTNIVTAVTADLATVTAVDGAGDTVVVTAVTAGTAGNSIVFTEASTNMAVDGSGTLGGTRAGVDGTLGNSELVMESEQTTNEIVVLDGTSNAHTLNTAIFNVAMVQNIAIPSAAKRMRLIVDNSYDADGSTLNYKAKISALVV